MGIIIEPRGAEPGDTVTLFTRVHNYSLKAIEKPIKVQWFMGDQERYRHNYAE
jgi:hypothetical protein